MMFGPIMNIQSLGFINAGVLADSGNNYGVFCIGFIIFLGLVIYLSNHGGRSLDASSVNNDSQLSYNRTTMRSRAGDDSSIYPVIYESGHGGIDHYLHWYAKRDHLMGNVGISENGFYYSSPYTKTEQKFHLGWTDVGSVILQNTNELTINSSKHGYIKLTVDEDQAEEIKDKINYFISNLHEASAYKKALEDAQICSRKLDSISPDRFEDLVCDLFSKMGYIVHRVGHTGDEGIDIRGWDSSSQKIVVQCKRYSGSVGAPLLRDFYGAVIHENASKGYFVTSGYYTNKAKEWSKGKNITLIDRDDLAELLDKFAL